MLRFGGTLVFAFAGRSHMATDDPQHDFRTASEISQPVAAVPRGADAIRVCESCSKQAGRTTWTGHEMQDDGSYDCLLCRERGDSE